MMPAQPYNNPPPSKTRSWATSAIVLGVIYFLLNILSLFNHSASVQLLGPARATISLIASIIDQIIALAFIIAGTIAQQGRSAGREALSYAAASAIVMTVLGGIWSIMVALDPNYVNALMKNGSAPGLPANFPQIIVVITCVMTVVFGVIQIVYNALLYRVMTAELPEPPSMPAGTPYYGNPTQGTWPPPPQA